MGSEPMRLNSSTVGERPLGLGSSLGRGFSLPRGLTWTGCDAESGEVLFREGACADRVFVVRRGLVKLVAHLPNGRVRILGLYGPGAILGMLTPASHGTTYKHTAFAVTDVEFEWAPLVQLRRIRRECSEDYLELVERYCEDLKAAERWITEFSADTTTCRIARVIKYLAELQSLPETDTVELLTCQEMAEVIGVSTESASRVLARFKRAGILTPAGSDSGTRQYRFDPDGIEHFASA